jgi:hypothetical protein
LERSCKVSDTIVKEARNHLKIVELDYFFRSMFTGRYYYTKSESEKILIGDLFLSRPDNAVSDMPIDELTCFSLYELPTKSNEFFKVKERELIEVNNERFFLTYMAIYCTKCSSWYSVYLISNPTKYAFIKNKEAFLRLYKLFKIKDKDKEGMTMNAPAFTLSFPYTVTNSYMPPYQTIPIWIQVNSSGNDPTPTQTPETDNQPDNTLTKSLISQDFYTPTTPPLDFIECFACKTKLVLIEKSGEKKNDHRHKRTRKAQRRSETT